MIYLILRRHLPRAISIVLTALVYALAIVAILLVLPVVSVEFRYLAH